MEDAKVIAGIRTIIAAQKRGLTDAGNFLNFRVPDVFLINFGLAHLQNLRGDTAHMNWKNACFVTKKVELHITLKFSL